MGKDEQIDAQVTKSKPSNESNLKTTVDDELTKIGNGGPWVWKLFFLCVTPNILNGFHVSSYVFLGQPPKDYWCDINELKNSNFSDHQKRTISSTNNGLGDGCKILNWDYSYLSSMSYDDAVSYTQSHPKPDAISCLDKPNNGYYYVQEPGSSIVLEWDLICEKSFWRTTVATAVSVGKFLGATTFGILSDKYGRRTCFIIGSIFYITGSVLTTFSPWYWLFLIGRVLLGSSSSGLFYPAFSLLTENIGSKHRSWMSIAFSMSYPVGMILLAISANYIHAWRQLQFSLTVPAFLLVFYCYFLSESPRWLISKGREAAAYRIVFNKKCDMEFEEKAASKAKEAEQQAKDADQNKTKMQRIFKELHALYGPSRLRRMALICHYTWCVTALSYYVTALNADNLAADRVTYVASTGAVDFTSLILSMTLLNFFGRKISSCGLFALSGFFLLSLIIIPRDNKNLIVFFAMAGRFGITAVYSIVTLHTAEMFPTSIRNSALGTSSTSSHVGSIMAPYVVDFLGQIAWYIPTTICGVLIVVAGMLCLTHPETRSKDLKDQV
ncbi:organic cation transporter protein isoform X1 [Contarinia nasturtii]|uniref:organic cation transporter protein isoform X1 n=1 Tax=Contarinia nasturtii TaxID=265458 RepID=UPI0012D42ED8|nr:organic cation transporter protein isoform X1 [Contarinia nasturtii]